MFAVLGLRDTYLNDGRVVTQALQAGATTPSLASNLPVAELLGDLYKQINAPFGMFSMEMIDVSTRALSADDTSYAGLEASIAALVARRDALAAQIRFGLDQAEFAGAPLDTTAANNWIVLAQALLADAAALDSSGASGTGGAGGAGGCGRNGRRAGDRRHHGDRGRGRNGRRAGDGRHHGTGGTTATGGTAGLADVVIYRVGDGTAALTSAATPVFLDEYSPAGTLVRSIALPVTTNGTTQPHRVTASGSATSEGLITRSVDAHYIVATGYDAAAGTAGVAATTSAAVPRTIARVDAAGNVDTTTALTDVASGNNPRSVAASDGSSFWVDGAAGGIRFATLGASTSTQLSTTLTNLRQAEIFGGQLFVSTSSGSALRIGTVGSGLPTTAGQSITTLPSFPTAGSPYAFYLADLDAGTAGLDTLYVADDGAGLQKYSLVAGSWAANGTIGTAADLYRGLTAVASGNTVTIFAVRGGSQLVTLVDTSGYNGAFAGTPSLLATAGTNTAFRGLAFAPQ